MIPRENRFWFVGIVVMIASSAATTLAQESPRITPTVRIIEKAEKAVLPIFIQNGPTSFGSGAGVVIHPKGFVLTADHVTQAFPGVVMRGLERVPFQVVGRVPERDVALLKIDPTSVRGSLSLGRSDDIKTGEPILIAGNPAGRGLVFSQGIVNSPSIDPSWPNMLAKSFWRSETQIEEFQSKKSTGGRPDFVQFDAVSNRGNSGGPLINMEGQVIGVVATKSFNEEGVNWAVPVDRVRLLMPYVIQPEAVAGFELGLEVDMLANEAMVVGVKSASPAEQIEMKRGDVILELDGQSVSSGPDWLMLLSEKKASQEIELVLRRDGQILRKKINLSPSSTESNISRDGKMEGILYERYEGRYSVLPDFPSLRVVKKGIVRTPGFSGIVKPDDSQFALVFSGWIEFPDAGLVRLTVGSDDGSKLFLDDVLTIDNDLSHPYQKLSRWVRVPKGLVPFRLEYADTGGDKQLSFSVTKDIEGVEAVDVRFFAVDE
jgi:S1-C subfamily serine protease